MQRIRTVRESSFSAVLCFALIMGSASLVQAGDDHATGDGFAPPLVAGAWTIESGRAQIAAESGQRVIEIHDARLRLEAGSNWTLTAQRVRLKYDALGSLESVEAHGGVRLIARTARGGSSEMSYAMGEHAWVDPTGLRGVLVGSDVALIRNNWRLRASHIQIDFGATKLGLRGVKSGPVRAGRDGN